MKKAAIALVLALVVGGVLASLMGRDPGYVLVVYDDLILETSLWFGLLALAAVWIVVRVIVAVIRRTLSVGSGVRGWNTKRRERQAREQTVRGMVLLTEGDWNGARAALLNSVSKSEMPFVNYLGAARAANELGETESRDRLLSHAAESAAGSSVGVRLAGAQMAIAAGDHVAAEATLAKLHEEAPRHVAVMRHLLECRVALGDIAGIGSLDKDLRRHKVLPEEDLLRLERQGIVKGLSAVSADEVSAAWDSIPKALKDDAVVVANGARAFERGGAADVAEEMLRKALKSDWSDELIEAYGSLASADPARQLEYAESLIKQHDGDAALYFALGRLATRADDAAKAREYLEKSVQLAPTPAAYAALGHVCLALNDADGAASYFAKHFAAE